ncbi:MAG: filamentous hemagglutinin N-terminal domain-containing protein [Verrucomicrobiales bacterium]|nr:filamentous hemagglutinin N-terminal domain-containing protein [Verrucomicrobiales bacterium]
MAIADDNPQQQGLKKGLFHFPLSGICGLLSAGLALGSLHPQVLRANPSGGAVAAGSAGISSHGSTLTITQGSNRAIINWQDFSISAGETTRFIQPSSSSAMLNRVIGGNPSQIHGRLQANGQVYLINPNGILVGPGGVVDTGGFLASTLDLSDDEFLRGGDLRFSGNSNASVINLGSIGASEGDVILIARTIENHGEIHAPKGTASLAAGSEVLVKASGEDRVFIEAGKGSVTNKGLIEGAAAEIKAAGGNEYALAINNEGTVRATGVSNSGGRIRLVANGGKIRQAGTLKATKAPTATENADVRVIGKDVEVTETSRIEAPGGFVETSGDRISIAPGSIVDTRAGEGTAGMWLIDPADLNVITGGGNDPTASTVDPLTVASLLNLSNITLQATNSITVSNLIDASANAAANSLTLDTVTLNLNAPIILKTGATLSGTSLLTTVNVGAGGRVQNGIDAVTANGTVNLAASTYNLPGTVNIAKNVTLNGTAGSTVLDAGNAFGVMSISAGTVTLDGLTLQRGRAISAGGLRVSGGANVTIRNSAITANASTNSSGSGEFGGGVLTAAGTTISIDRSTISNNTARYGAGVDHYGVLTITNSTISGNVASSSGGGAYINPGASLSITNSTVANNRSSGVGTGLDNDGGTLIVRRTTVVGNVGATGGGIYSGGGTFTMGHSLVVGNTASLGPDMRVVGGTVTSEGYNILGSISGFTPNGTTDVTYTGALADIVQTSAGAVVLADNGGPTQTVALVHGSAAYLTGGPNPGGLLDQRGRLRGANISVGAYDADPTTLSHVVTTTADNRVIGSSQNSLRSAIWAINQGYGSGNAVTFDSAGVFATAQTITLSLGELVPSESMSITGSTAGVTINANSLSRVMRFAGTGADTFTLDRLNLTGGRVSGAGVAGGGIEFVNSGTLNLLNSTVSGNQSLTTSGGGIYLYGAALNVTNSTISGNTSFSYGGGIEAIASSGLSVLNSTIANNTSQYGGGIDVDSTTTTITNSTISGNTATGDSRGGGVYVYSGSVTVTNTIIAGNTATNSPDVDGTFIDGGYNLIGNVGNAGGFTVSTLVGTSAAPLNARLSALGNYGGPTQTFGLLPGSIAINAGSATGNDQRGFGRVGTADIGSFESQGFTYSVVSGSGQQAELAAAFANPLVVGVTATNGLDPVVGGIVNLVLPSSGASATGTFQQTINASAQASFSLTANTTLGAYSAAVQGSPSTTFNLENTRIALTVTLNPGQGKVYGNTDPALTYLLTSGSFLPGDAFTGSLARAAGENVGPYSVNLGTLTAGGNYNVSYQSGGNSFTITPRDITVTALGGTSEYGQNPSNPGLSATNLASFDDISALTGLSNSFGIDSTSPVNSYTLNVAGTLTNPNYNVTATNPGSWSVTPKALTIAAGDQSKIYGDTFTFAGTEFTASGLINNDTVTSVTFASTGAVNTATVAGGPYAITASGAIGTGLGNYTIGYTAGSLTVGQRDITVTALGGTSAYGQSPSNPGLSATNLASFDTASALTGLSNSFGIDSTSPINTYTLNVAGMLTNGNYNVTATNPGSWSVTPRELTITVNNLSKIYGNTLTFAGTEFTTSGLINNDTVTSATLASAGAVNTASVAGGPYDITGSMAVGTGLENYTINYVSGSLTVTPRPIRVTALGGRSQAGKKARNPGLRAENLASFDSLSALQGLKNGFKITSRTPAGKYALRVVGNLSNPNYEVVATTRGTWIVLPGSQSSISPPRDAAGRGKRAR